MAASTDLDNVTEVLDECDGPVGVPLAGRSTVLVAEHDYCGGSAWSRQLHRGQPVRLSGPGVESGAYMVGERQHAVRGEARVRDLPDTDAVLQTCLNNTKLVLLGMMLVGLDVPVSVDLAFGQHGAQCSQRPGAQKIPRMIQIV